MTVKITVVTAVLNQVEAFRGTARSVLEQSYPNLDYIVVDGGSTDGTAEVVQEYGDRLANWVSEPDDGVYQAMNKGWALADPESYVLFLGAGDCLLHLPMDLPVPGARPEVYYGRVMLDGGQEFFSYANWRLKLYNSLHHQGLLVPKKVHPEPPFNQQFRLYADFDFNQKLMKKGCNFRFMPELMSFAAPGGLTKELQVGELIKIIRYNFGLVWAGASALGFYLSRFVPYMKKIRPIR